jgi:hypothetical protein
LREAEEPGIEKATVMAQEQEMVEAIPVDMVPEEAGIKAAIDIAGGAVFDFDLCT